MMNRFFLIISSIVIAITLFGSVATVVATSSSDYWPSARRNFEIFLDFGNYGAVADERVNNPITAVATVVRTALAFMGAAILIVILYSGFRWMTAGGNEEQVTEAKKWLINGVIGMVLILLAYAIAYFVIFWFGYGFMGGPFTSP